MPRRSALRASSWALILLGFACDGPRTTETPEPPPGPAGDRAGDRAQARTCGEHEGVHRLRILHLNDVYRIEGLLDGRGGIARVRALRSQLEADCDAVLVTHAGDTLYPSLISREYGGEQMIDALNVLDGDPEAVDANLFATFGNHEFDKTGCSDAAKLGARIEQSQFAWLATSLVWTDAATCATREPATGPCPSSPAEPMVASSTDNILPHAMIELAGLKIGVYSLMVDNAFPDYVACIDTRFIERSHAAVTKLRADGAQLVLALTHLDAADDASLLAGDGRDGYAPPDMILGGHDHSAMTRDASNRELGVVSRIEGSAPLVVKGDADAVRVRTLELEVRPGPAGAAPELRYAIDTVTLDAAITPDPQVDAVVSGWIDEHQRWFCSHAGLPEGCLATKLADAGVDLIAEETQIRKYETNVGSWVADQMIAALAGAKHPPQIALINSGSLRLNQDVTAGTPVTRQIVEELFAYPAPLAAIEVNGHALRAALEHSVSAWEAAGHWAQISGLAFYHDNLDGRSVAKNITVVGADGPAPLNDDAMYWIALPEYLAAGNDGYWMFNKAAVAQRAKTDPAAKKVIVKTKFTPNPSAPDLDQVVLAELTRLGEAKQPFSAAVRGRICSADRQPPAVPCLAPKPQAAAAD